jgi:hypothetical protein
MTSPARLHPFDLVFGSIRETSFPAIHAELGDHDSLEEFLLCGAAIELMRDLRPDAGLADGVDDFVLFVYSAYRYWRDGEHTVRLDEAETDALMMELPMSAAGVDASARDTRPPVGSLGASYIQVAGRRIWAQCSPDAPFEPLDGWFAVPGDGALQVAVCLGVHADRPGLSIITARGARPPAIRRSDGSSAFAPVMPGGDRAGLHAIVLPEELLWLAWQARASEESE